MPRPGGNGDKSFDFSHNPKSPLPHKNMHKQLAMLYFSFRVRNKLKLCRSSKGTITLFNFFKSYRPRLGLSPPSIREGQSLIRTALA